MSSEASTVVKFVVVGSAGVGKTSLLNRFVDKRFTSLYKSTIGADFKQKDVVVTVDGRARNATMQIWDTAGQERFQSIGQSFYRGADGCVLVYDITQQESFEAMEMWYDEFCTQANVESNADFPFMLVGNKSDLGDRRKVATARAASWAKHKGIRGFFECSASEDQNVSKAFEDVAARATQRADATRQSKASAYAPVSLNAAPAKGGCAC